MNLEQTIETSENSGLFPKTHWSKLRTVREGTDGERINALNYIIEGYWKPVYCYVRRCGHDSEKAKDLVQQFFTNCLEGELFSKANPARGRFRNFLLASLNNFLVNAHRAEKAAKRRPDGGFVSIHELVETDGFRFEPQERETPEAVFHRIWVRNLIERIQQLLERECKETGKMKHLELFHQWIVLPIIDGVEPPPLNILAERAGLSARQASACVITARRAFQRLLRLEIQQYSSNEEEVTAEIRDLFHFIANE